MISKTFSKKYFLSLVPQTARNIIGVYSGDILSKGIAVLATVIIIRTLSMKDYGLYTNFLATMNFIGLVVGNGINSSTTRYCSEYMSINENIPPNAFTYNLIMQVTLYIPILALLFIYSSDTSNIFFGTGIYSRSVLLGGLASLGVILTQIVATIFQASEKFTKYVTLLNGKQVLLLGGVFVLWMTHFITFTTVAYLIISLQILLGLTLIVIYRQWFMISGWDSTFLKEFLSSGGMLILFYFFLALFSQLDIFMISRFQPVEQLAVYGVAFRYYSVTLMLLGSIHAVLLPKFSRVEYLDKKKQRDFICKWLMVSSLSIIPISMMAIYAKPLFLLLNGEAYYDSVAVFRIFCIGIVVSLMFSPLVNILISRKVYTYITTIALIALIMNFLGNLLVIQKYGILGVTIVTVATYSFVNTLMFVGVILWTEK